MKKKITLDEKAALYARVRDALQDRVYKVVAENCYMTSETVRKVANGTASPSMGTLTRLADYLGASQPTSIRSASAPKLYDALRDIVLHFETNCDPETDPSDAIYEAILIDPARAALDKAEGAGDGKEE